jgi:hypothetical protein
MSNQTNVRANKMNSTEKLAFFNARKRTGDTTRIAETTGYSVSHVYNMANGNRRITTPVANAMYRLTYRRVKNNELV